ncbi:MAG: carboxymuconolactone decarboxylase family protein [Actinocatenispora sp.]
MTSEMASAQTLDAVAHGDGVVLETLAQMHLDTLTRSGLSERTYHLVRLGVLVAIDAPPASYAVNLEAARESGVTIEEVQGLLTAIAPLVGGPRVVAAAGKALELLDVATGAE